MRPVLAASLALLASLAVAGPAAAGDGYPMPREGQGREDFRSSVSDAYEGAGRLAAIRGLSERMGDIQESLVDGLRLRALVRGHATAGVSAAEARGELLARGMPQAKVDAAVARLMRADADGDGRVTMAEFQDAQGATAAGAIAAVRDAIGEAPSNRQSWVERGLGLYDQADADRDGRIGADEALAFARRLGAAR